ncbi:MAG: hypothetical protein M0P16_02190 [Syntrophales bacterium]|nr:hypothetical protein [Syntrophales bacterium]MCK9392131.1 hypothetical protein [Syntrophales bacterium]
MEKSKWSLYVMGVLGVLVIAMFFWKVIAVQNVEKKMAEERKSITEKSQQLLTDNTRGFLRLTTVPLVWAVRKEMIQGNYDQINEYAKSYVKERNMQQIVLVKADGTIAVATDKKIEGAQAKDVFPPQLLEQNDVSITEVNNGNLQVAAPIMGLNAKLGTLILIYKPERIIF